LHGCRIAEVRIGSNYRATTRDLLQHIANVHCARKFDSHENDQEEWKGDHCELDRSRTLLLPADRVPG